MRFDFQCIHGLDEAGAMVALHHGLRLRRFVPLGRRLGVRAARLHHAILHVHAVHHPVPAALLHTPFRVSSIHLLGKMLELLMGIMNGGLVPCVHVDYHTYH